ncbi:MULTISPECIES: tRNA (adenosine(37)-N6)-dimethylallyltransferase MiaA [unclassified Rhizobium]|uniref:tRNA (adenosine(37)-N6)-dimethylallyltransferase MiaA n=1 Tax=unclassified Rhizobium TaxID=2613769 RepID=UPI000DDD653C|nr:MULTISPECIES: tRNA (adenosine(37)-N6)-dimethylallyltransferase MiaA [unclassified Rhizobium]MBB3285938.1 tRNA dimethylallyltransferase [Rhizobium sp. BK252]MBB3400900.1 tRNA dimethylallyltransferase [Rhizobium sp. BK289]MBB3413256.1 tRNA dimethylallyltransferase [Rhizobium sp. BK284]MBB3481366.1 tRNA dimethylallyltransferase [Rhizobium sp. BK347]MDK4723195.1 tRNA (adenosine(37)-N6)-dimethylallyltransferase MiaA [Rhizobium sp. CNPSo 3968]
MSRNLVSDIDAILITGPTASGKSALAVELARLHGGVVINADSMQVYDTLRVLTARPSEAEMEGIPHHLYGHVPAGQAYSTGAWLREAGVLVERLRDEGRLPVFVGGTGLYFKALAGGLSDMPEIPPDIRSRLRSRLLAEGAEALYGELAERDSAIAETLNPQDGQRIVRALEVREATGRSIAAFQGKTGPMVIDPDRARKIVVLPERALLHQRINSRFETMLAMGAEEEVRALLALDLSPEMPVMKAIGVSQIAAMLKGEMTREEVIETGAAATRQYAKRQMTWFRNQMDESWERLSP